MIRPDVSITGWHRPVVVSAVAVVAVLALTLLLYPNWVRKPRLADLPAPRDVESMEISLWGEQMGRKDLIGYRVSDRDFSIILRCLSPAEYSEGAGKMMGLPPLGKVRISLRDGRERQIVFVAAGKNPLCFTLDGVPYLRGGTNYLRYSQDHRDLYGLPYENLDEAMCLVDKLTEISVAGEPRR
jgi:hypothetical protein